MVMTETVFSSRPVVLWRCRDYSPAPDYAGMTNYAIVTICLGKKSTRQESKLIHEIISTRTQAIDL